MSTPARFSGVYEVIEFAAALRTKELLARIALAAKAVKK